MEIVDESRSLRVTLAAASVAFCLLVSGCAAPVPADFCKALAPESVMPQHSIEVKQGSPLVYEKHKLAQDAIGYAIFSNNAYDKNETFMTLPDGWQDFCAKARGDGRCEVISKGAGFQAKVYVKSSSDGDPMPSEVVLAYRGTTSLNDWFFGNFFKGQYERANNFVLETLTALDDRYPGLVAKIEARQVPLVATGHSLGGGLAEHTAYCFTGLDVHAVSFDTSPRNFKRSCDAESKHGANYRPPFEKFAARPDEARLNDIQRNQIHRIHQSREILSPLRFFFSDKDYADTRYHFLHGKPTSRHSMTAIAMGLTKVASCPMELDPDKTRPPDGAARTRYEAICPGAASPCYNVDALRTEFRKAVGN